MLHFTTLFLHSTPCILPRLVSSHSHQHLEACVASNSVLPYHPTHQFNHQKHFKTDSTSSVHIPTISNSQHFTLPPQSVPTPIGYSPHTTHIRLAAQIKGPHNTSLQIKVNICTTHTLLTSTSPNTIATSLYCTPLLPMTQEQQAEEQQEKDGDENGEEQTETRA